MARLDAILRRARSGLRQLLSWYRSPVGTVFGLVLLLALVFDVLGVPQIATPALVVVVGVLVPWKLLRQTTELRQHVAWSSSQIRQLDEVIATTPTFGDVDRSMRGVRRDTRKTLRTMRGRLVELRVAQHKGTAALRNEAATTELLVRDLETSVDRWQTEARRQMDTIASLQRQISDLEARLSTAVEQVDAHGRAMAQLEEEKTNIVSDGSAKHYFLSPGYRRRSELIGNFDDTGNEDEWQREVYDYALGVAHQSGAKRICDFGTGSGFKFMSRFRDFETTGIDVAETVEHLQKTYPDRTWLVSGEITPELFDGYDLVIASDVIEHLIEPDVLLDALARSNVGNIVLSTPARELLLNRGDRPLGPPANAHHYLEWNQEEFRMFVSQYLDVVLQRISNEPQATQLLHARRR